MWPGRRPKWVSRATPPPLLILTCLRKGLVRFISSHARMRRVLIFLVKGYQATLSRVLRPACRFVPTCSEYMIECLEKKGVLRGLLKGAWRLLRCNPLFPGGYDPVEQDEPC